MWYSESRGDQYPHTTKYNRTAALQDQAKITFSEPIHQQMLFKDRFSEEKNKTTILVLPKVAAFAGREKRGQL